jgi:sortase A
MDDVHYRFGRRRSMLFGITAMLAAFGLTVGILVLFNGPNDDEPVTRVAEAAELEIPETLPASDEPFAALDVGGPTVAAPAAPSTTTTTTTTAGPTTTTAPSTIAPTSTVATTVAPTTAAPTTETLVSQPTAPIAPPPDPHAAEPQIQLGRIAIPKLGVDEPLYEGIRLTTLDLGPGHWPGTAMPGEVGNAVIAGHRTSHSAPFRYLDQLVPGDTIEFTTTAGVTTYEVTETMIVQPDAVWIVDPTPTATATLFACHPPGSVSQRIVVKLDLA